MANIEKLNQFIKDMETLKEKKEIDYCPGYDTFNYKKLNNNILLTASKSSCLFSDTLIICDNTTRKKIALMINNQVLLQQEIIINYTNYYIMYCPSIAFIDWTEEVKYGIITKEEAEEESKNANIACIKWKDLINNKLKNPSDTEQLFINCITQ